MRRSPSNAKTAEAARARREAVGNSARLLQRKRKLDDD